MTHFGTLGTLSAALPRLFETVGASETEKDLLTASYELLRRSIRNRDAHAYGPNVRDSHYSLVPQLFSDCFNVLASWLPNGPTTLSQWRADAKQFITSLWTLANQQKLITRASV
jgi:hypothetical protein